VNDGVVVASELAGLDSGLELHRIFLSSIFCASGMPHPAHAPNDG
jgi:hypothetical protein